MKMKRLTIVAAVIATATTLQAQTYNDTVRTHTWSIYGQGGVSFAPDWKAILEPEFEKPYFARRSGRLEV